MATTKFYLDKRTPRKDGKSPLKINVTHNRKAVFINLDIFLTPEQWDEKAEKITKHPNKAFLNNFITRRKIDIETILLKLSDCKRLNLMTIAQIKDHILAELDPAAKERGTFVTLYRKFVELKNKPRTKEIYEVTLSHMYKFCPELDRLNFENITKDWLISFDAFLAQTSPSRNARNIHLRNIRAVFNEAIDDEVTSFYPFRKFKIKGEATIKRSLTVEELRAIFYYPVEECQRKYRDVFILMFCLIGINAVDLCNLKTTDVMNGRIAYRRAKTGRLYDVKLEPEAIELVEKYRGEKYLINILDRYKDYRDYTKRMNDNLQQIGEIRIGKQGKKTYKPLFPNLTTYWTRHSWATVAASLDIPKETIAAALGHGGNTVTDIYIRFDQKKVDEANRRVLDWVFYGKR